MSESFDWTSLPDELKIMVAEQDVRYFTKLIMADKSFYQLMIDYPELFKKLKRKHTKETKYKYGNGNLKKEIYTLFGKLHREDDLPVYKSYLNRRGDSIIKDEAWFYHGLPSKRPNDEPFYVRYTVKGNVVYRAWVRDHDDNQPSFMGHGLQAWFDHNTKKFYPREINGPCAIDVLDDGVGEKYYYCDNDGNIIRGDASKDEIQDIIDTIDITASIKKYL